MKKKQYQKPTMQVVKLQHHAQLLQASGSGSLQDYDWNGYDEQ